MTEAVSAFLFMTKSPFAKSQRKYIRKEKARIRREFFDLKKQQEEIVKLLDKVSGKTQPSAPVAKKEEKGKIEKEKPSSAKAEKAKEKK